ncbi:MAG: sugar phosphate isomerase/epimerase [Bryobacteraceae bacterium]|nr:sugar phosphate isomerase/epimerase [Bryobacteraceae bacterium]
MPKLAAFPKAFMDHLCVDGTMTVREWIVEGAALGVDGLEFYAGMLDLQKPGGCAEARRIAAEEGVSIPMFCCSPDFTHPDPDYRRRQVDNEKRWIDMTVELGGQYCRVLSGQRRPEVSREDGLRYVTESIEACLPHAAAAGVTLIIENHYKDNYWHYPEFAQRMDVFCELIDRIRSPHFGVNYDPSNTILAGEDPLELLRRVRHRVVTMHASDRYLAEGTLEDLRREEDSAGYAKRLRHGVIGEGLNDYDAIFSLLAEAGFNGWISIEDGVEGLDQMRRSVMFLREKIARHWPRRPLGATTASRA